MKEVYTVIPHVHWDREWYFTQEKSLVYSFYDFDDIIESLENDDDISCYLLDAQTSIIYDYLQYRPHMRERVKELVNKKRLLIGPWYTQSDQMLISGESLTRNLLLGIRQAGELGYCFKVGYAVDCFGQSAQMPQIYQEFGIPYTLIKRGISCNKIPSREFIWKNENGEVLAYHIEDYMNFQNPSADVEKNVELIQQFTSGSKIKSLSGEYILFNGFDQYPIRKDISSIVNAIRQEGKLDIKIDNIENVLGRLAHGSLEYPVYNGELTYGHLNRVHKSIYSSRADIKALNARSETMLANIIDPLNALNYLLIGRDESELIWSLWKYQMENAAHDSIGCCNSDQVNESVKGKFLHILETAKQLENIIYRDFANRINDCLFDIQVYNYLPYKRTETIHMKIISPFPNISLVNPEGIAFETKVNDCKNVTEKVKKILTDQTGINGSYRNDFNDYDKYYELDIESNIAVQGIGYDTLKIREQQSKSNPSNIQSNLQVWLENNELLILDKRNQKIDRLYVVDDGDDGDSYDYSKPATDSIQKAVIERLELNEETKSRLEGVMYLKIPGNLKCRALGLLDSEVKIDFTIGYSANSSMLNIHFEVENNAVEHRLRVFIKTEISSTVSYAEQQFGMIERPTELEDIDWEGEQWAEKPRTIEPMLTYVALKEAKRVTGIISMDINEYEIVGENKDIIALTLFRSFCYMGKNNLADRPGRASGMEWETPDNNMRKRMSFDFSYYTAADDNIEGLVYQAKAYSSPIRYHQELHAKSSGKEFIFADKNKTLPSTYSLIPYESNHVVMSTAKVSEDKKGVIFRYYHIQNSDVKINGTNIYQCNLKEVISGKPDGSIQGNMNQVKTILFELNNAQCYESEDSI